MRPLYKKSFKDITQRKLRAVLTILGIAIGVLGLTAISITQGQIKSAIQYSEDATRMPDISYFTSPTTKPVLDGLRSSPNVRAAEAVGFVYTQWQIPSGRKPLQVIGFPNLRQHQVYNFELSAGSWPAPGQILMESNNSGLSPVHVGDRVTLKVRGHPQTLVVSGLVRTRGRPSSSFLSMGLAYMRLPDLQHTFHAPGVNFFMIRLTDYSSREADAKSLEHVFQANRVTILQPTVGHDETLSTMTNGILGVMQVLSIIALLLSVFLLLSTVTTLVTEQIRIIGTMKAIGATRGAVMRNYLASVALYGIFGTILGFALGLVAASVLINIIGTTFTLDTGSLQVGVLPIILAILVGIGVPLLAAIVPVYFGTRLTVHDALVGYGLVDTKRHGRFVRAMSRVLTFVPGILQLGPRGVFGRRTRTLLSFVPGTMQLGVRNLFRKRTRALLTLLALSVSSVAFLSVQTTSYSFSSFVTHLMDTYNFDVMANLTRPEPYGNVRSALANTPGIARIEQMSQVPVTTDWGAGAVSGVEPTSQLYKHQLVEGRWFTASDRNVVVLSTQARDKSHLTVGDDITVRDKLHTGHWRIIGIATDYNGITTKFGNLLTSVEQTNRFRNLPLDLTDGVILRSTDQSQAAVNALSRQVDDKLAAAGLNATVQTAKETKDRIAGMISILDVMLYAVAIIVALVGAIGLFNSLAMSVLERRREIGILRSMGATGRKVAGVFWTEAISLGALAWMIGVILGIPAAYGFVWLIQILLMPVPFAFNLFGLVFMLAFIVIVATLASVIPVWGAARVRIAQTLRYEG